MSLKGWVGRIVFTVLLGIVFVFWISGTNEAFKRNTERVRNLEDRIGRVEAAVPMLRAGLCHEVNMRSSRPSSELNEVECIRFLDEVSKDLRKAKGGAGLVWTLTPSPTPCDQRVGWCPQQKR